MGSKLVLALMADGANDALRGMITDYAATLQSLGLPVVELSFDSSELNYAVEQMQAGNVAFAFTWLGVGQDLSAKLGDQNVNLWEHFRVPLLKLHGDSPAYFSSRHTDVPKNSVNFYAAQEFIDFRTRWLSGATSLTALLPPMPLAPVERKSVDAATRAKGTLVFM
jgi:hypothetical protein